MKTALVIGANGFIGQMLCAFLKKNGISVTATARNTSKSLNVDEFVTLDITDYSDVSAVFQQRGYDVVYQLAAVTEHHKLVDEPISCLEAYATGAVNVAKAFIQSKSSRLVYTSTGKVYGPMVGNGISESHHVAPSNILGHVKLISENILSFAMRNSKKTLAIARIFNVYGAGQKATFLIPTVLNQLKVCSTIKLGNLDDLRDYIYSEDLVRALGVLGRASMPCGVHIYNIGSGTPLSVRQILEQIEMQVGFDIKVVTDSTKLRTDEYSVEYADISKIKNLGWSAEVSLQEGIQKTIEYYAPNLRGRKT